MLKRPFCLTGAVGLISLVVASAASAATTTTTIGSVKLGSGTGACMASLVFAQNTSDPSTPTPSPPAAG